MTKKKRTIRTRTELIYLLSRAAELEHGLSLCYLYAAYSLKKDESEGLSPLQVTMVTDWQSTLTEIARQEMEHLGFCCNLLTAVGGAPRFLRPNFPTSAEESELGLEMALEPLSPETIERFVEFEKPSDEVEKLECDENPAPDLAQVPLEWHNIQQLYELIAHAFECMPEEELFIGPPEAQVDSEAIGLLKGFRAYGIKLFDVTDRKSAREAINQILEEGEGRTIGSELYNMKSHYDRFKRMLVELNQERDRDPNFSPARPVISNPVTRQAFRGAEGGNMIEDPFTWQVAELCNAAYDALLLTLIRFYAHTDESPSEIQGLQETAFFPLMVMMVRPLAELLTRLPAGEEKYPGQTAGPSFEVYREIDFLPHKAAAWRILGERLDLIARKVEELMNGVPDSLPEPLRSSVKERLTFMHENFYRIHMNFVNYMGLAGTGADQGG